MRAFVTLMLLSMAGNAQAHQVSTGINAFYDGLVHIYLLPASLLPVLALAALAGLSGTPASRAVTLAFPLAWLAGSVLGLQGSTEQVWPWLTIISFIGLGGAIGFGLRLNGTVLVTIALLVGCIHGFVNTSGLSDMTSSGTYLIGSVSSVAIPILIVSACVLRLRQDWLVIAVRVLGSWLAAAGILTMGWHLAGALQA